MAERRSGGSECAESSTMPDPDLAVKGSDARSGNIKLHPLLRSRLASPRTRFPRFPSFSRRRFPPVRARSVRDTGTGSLTVTMDTTGLALLAILYHFTYATWSPSNTDSNHGDQNSAAQDQVSEKDQECPTRCLCFPGTVNCQGRGLKTIPSDIPEGTRRLLLQTNGIESLRPDQLVERDLRIVLLRGNALTGLKPHVFRDLLHLETLDLAANPGLGTLPVGAFTGLVSLRSLSLYGCGLSWLPPQAFSSLSGLLYLHLQENLLVTLEPGVFTGLFNLTTLFLYTNRLVSLQPNAFAGLPRLDCLLLHGNRLVQIYQSAFRGLTSLSTLYLFNNSLSHLDAVTLQNLTSLRYLRLNGNPWACGCSAASLWDFLNSFHGSSSEAICSSPTSLVGQDLKSLSTMPPCEQGPIRREFAQSLGATRPEIFSSAPSTSKSVLSRPPPDPPDDDNQPNPSAKPSSRRCRKRSKSRCQTKAVINSGAGSIRPTAWSSLEMLIPIVFWTSSC
uniref:Reticulon 4 receptor-like 2b n=1 Tax=Eptatretus burgeri TaxID=7764 RepID=A0A8C4R1L4_EPTBU